MTYGPRTRRLAFMLAGILTLLLLSAPQVLAGGGIDPTNKWVWSTNAGWINFNPAGGGVMVYSDHLAGTAWGENIGWIRMGTYTGSGAFTYANTAAGNYGVNNDGAGNLSGYAWSTNAGWINFDPTGDERVTIDPATGDFDGYAWAENVGWIHFRNASPAYRVNTEWRANLGGIDATNKWAWGTAVGWLNFAPECAGCEGASVYSDHLEGTAWAENAGWIRLGTHAGGGAHTYANNTADSYGLNNDGVGNLSGYAWGGNIGWINFKPANGGVTVDPVTGAFDGYAWAENAGWIHFKNADPAYAVISYWRGDLVPARRNDIAAIITQRRPDPASSTGLIIGNGGFLHDAGDGIIFGHNGASYALVTDHLPVGVGYRWSRVWQLDLNDGAGTTGGAVTVTFDISDAGGQGTFNNSSVYMLLKRATGSNDTFVVVPVDHTTVFGDQVTLTVDAAALGSEFTLGSSSPAAVTLDMFAADVVDDHILVTWETASELNNRGFNLWRGTSPTGPDRRLNSTLIPSQSLGNPGGFVYTWVDESDLQAGTTYYYWLEDVDINNAVTRHGPVSVTFAVPTAVSLTEFDAIAPRSAVLPVLGVVAAALGGLAAARRWLR